MERSSVVRHCEVPGEGERVGGEGVVVEVVVVVRLVVARPAQRA